MGSFGERERKSTGIQLGIKPGTFQILVGNTVITEPQDSWQRSRNLKVCPGGHTPWNPIVLKHPWLDLLNSFFQNYILSQEGWGVNWQIINNNTIVYTTFSSKLLKTALKDWTEVQDAFVDPIKTRSRQFSARSIHWSETWSLQAGVGKMRNME